MRGLFFAIVATGGLAAVLLWGGSDGSSTLEPAESPQPMAQTSGSAGPEQTSVDPAPARSIEPAKPVLTAAVPKTPTPIETLELSDPEPFLAPTPEVGAPGPALEMEAETQYVAPKPRVADFDPDRSAALVRRMLAVYEAVLE